MNLKIILSFELEGIFFENKSKHFSEIMCRNRVVKGLCVTRDLSKNSPVMREISQNLVVTRELLGSLSNDDGDV